jgi:hypothetical protein
MVKAVILPAQVQISLPSPLLVADAAAIHLAQAKLADQAEAAAIARLPAYAVDAAQ